MDDNKSVWCLIRQGNVTRQTNFQLKTGITKVGKILEADIIIFSKFISKLHCDIIVDNTSVRIKDLNSSNGTYVNDIQYKGVETEVKEDSIIGFGVWINGNFSIHDPEIFIYRLKKNEDVIEISDDDSNDTVNNSIDDSNFENVLDGVKQSVKLIQRYNIKDCSVVAEKLPLSNLHLQKQNSPKAPKRRLSKADDRFYSNPEKMRKIEETRKIQRRLSMIVDSDDDDEIDGKNRTQKQSIRTETVTRKSNVKKSAKIEETRKIQRRLSMIVDSDDDDEIDGKNRTQKQSIRTETVTRKSNVKKSATKIPTVDVDSDSDHVDGGYKTRTQTTKIEIKPNNTYKLNNNESELFDQVRKKFNAFLKLTGDEKPSDNKPKKNQRRFTIAEDPVYDKNSNFRSLTQTAKKDSILKETKTSNLEQKKKVQFGQNTNDKTVVDKNKNSKIPEKKINDPVDTNNNSSGIPKKPKPMRRKSTSIIETFQKKITKITTFKEVTTKVKNTELITLRKAKLRELAIREKQEKWNIENDHQHSNNTAKVKITENNRMDKMLNDIQSQSNNVCLAGKITKRRNTVAVIAGTPTPTICKLEVQEPIVAEETVNQKKEEKDTQPEPIKSIKLFEDPPSATSRTTFAIRRRNTIALDSDDLSKEISFASMNSNKPENLLKSCLNKNPCSTRKGVQFNNNLVETKLIHAEDEDDTEADYSPSSFSPISSETIELIPKDPEICFDRSLFKYMSEAFYREILRWNTDDFINFMKCGRFPEIDVGLKDIPSVVSKNCNNFEEYKRVLIPSIKLEMWANILINYPNINQRISIYLMVQNIMSQDNRIVIMASIKDKQKCYMGNLVMVCYNIDFKKSSFITCFGYILSQTYHREWNETTIEIQIRYDQQVLQIKDKLAVIKIKPIDFIRHNMKTMSAIKTLQQTELIKIVMNPELAKPIFNLDIEYSGTNLDSNQKNILSKIITECINKFNVPNILAVEGGSGTGKTEILISAVSDIYKYGLKMFNHRFKFLICTVNYSCMKQITAVLLKKKYADSLCNYNLFEENLEILTDDNEQIINSRNKSIQEADIVCTTFDRSNQIFRFEKHFDFCFMDEATKVADWQMVVPLTFDLTKIILFGDSRQFPITQVNKVFKLKPDSSLFSRMVEVNKAAVLKLNYQYRMHPHILKFPNFYFYKNELKTLVNQISMPVLFPYAVFELHEVHQTSTRPDHIEINFALKIVNKILVKYSFSIYKNILGDYTYGIFTSNDQQKNELRKRLSKGKGQCKLNISVHSIDSLGSAEFDVVIICATDSMTNKISAIANNPQVALVALTRAKRALYICGNLFSLNSNKLWFNLAQDALRRGCFYYGSNDRILDILTS